MNKNRILGVFAFGLIAILAMTACNGGSGTEPERRIQPHEASIDKCKTPDFVPPPEGCPTTPGKTNPPKMQPIGKDQVRVESLSFYLNNKENLTRAEQCMYANSSAIVYCVTVDNVSKIDYPLIVSQDQCLTRIDNIKAHAGETLNVNPLAMPNVCATWTLPGHDNITVDRTIFSDEITDDSPVTATLIIRGFQFESIPGIKCIKDLPSQFQWTVFGSGRGNFYASSDDNHKEDVRLQLATSRFDSVTEGVASIKTLGDNLKDTFTQALVSRDGIKTTSQLATIAKGIANTVGPQIRNWYNSLEEPEKARAAKALAEYTAEFAPLVNRTLINRYILTPTWEKMQALQLGDNIPLQDWDSSDPYGNLADFTNGDIYIIAMLKRCDQTSFNALRDSVRAKLEEAAPPSKK